MKENKSEKFHPIICKYNIQGQNGFKILLQQERVKKKTHKLEMDISY